MTTIGGLRKLRHCGGVLLDWIVTFTAAISINGAISYGPARLALYNLVRLGVTVQLVPEQARFLRAPADPDAGVPGGLHGQF